jgi:hypothetical protein
MLLFAAGPIIATYQVLIWRGYCDVCDYGCGGYVHTGGGFYSYDDSSLD